MKRRVVVRMELEYGFLRHTGTFAGIHDYAQEHGWRLIIDEQADQALPTDPQATVPYDGLIGRITAIGARRALRIGLPTVNVWFSSPAKQLPGVFPDYAETGRLCAEHLLNRGFRSIGIAHHFTYRGPEVTAEAIEQVVREAGLESSRFEWLRGRDGRPTLTPNARQWRYAVRMLDRWLDTLSPPIGLFVDVIGLARLIIEACRVRGWRVPEDVAIIAGANEPVLCERPEPSITSVDYGFERVGYQAAGLLEELMAAKERGDPQEPQSPRTILVPPAGIVIRHSSDCHAVSEPRVRRALRFINEHLGQAITIDRVAAALDVSRRTITQLFREHLGRGVAEEVQRLRLERVKRELVASKRPIGAIARDAGFASMRTMNDVFHKAVGCKPTDYRKTHASDA